MQGSLHEHAVQAEAHLEKLATGLAEAGADPNAVKGVGAMADEVRKIVKALGKGQEQTGDKEPPAPAPPPEQQPRRPTLDSATADLHRDTQAAAATRGEAY